MHLQVPPNLTIQVAHALAGKVKALLRSAIPGLTGVLIHVEPFLTPDDCARESPPTEASG
jgi:divalent metal cation (Fe/Co/Zn/Cd) transporter